MNIDEILEPKFIEGQYVQNKYYLECKTLIYRTYYKRMESEPIFKLRYKQLYKINNLWVIVKHEIKSCDYGHEVYYREYTSLWKVIKDFIFKWNLTMAKMLKRQPGDNLTTYQGCRIVEEEILPGIRTLSNCGSERYENPLLKE